MFRRKPFPSAFPSTAGPVQPAETSVRFSETHVIRHPVLVSTVDCSSEMRIPGAEIDVNITAIYINLQDLKYVFILDFYNNMTEISHDTAGKFDKDNYSAFLCVISTSSKYAPVTLDKATITW